MTVNDKVDENYGEFGADGGWFWFLYIFIQYSSVSKPRPEWTSSHQNCSNQLRNCGNSLLAYHQGWHHPAKRRMGKIEGLTFDFASWLVGYVYNRSGGGQAIPATPGLPQCQAQCHKATIQSQFHTQIHSSRQKSTMPCTSKIFTIVHKSVLFNLPMYTNSVH